MLANLDWYNTVNTAIGERRDAQHWQTHTQGVQRRPQCISCLSCLHPKSTLSPSHYAASTLWLTRFIRHTHTCPRLPARRASSLLAILPWCR